MSNNLAAHMYLIALNAPPGEKGQGLARVEIRDTHGNMEINVRNLNGKGEYHGIIIAKGGLTDAGKLHQGQEASTYHMKTPLSGIHGEVQGVMVVLFSSKGSLHVVLRGLTMGQKPDVLRRAEEEARMRWGMSFVPPHPRTQPIPRPEQERVPRVHIQPEPMLETEPMLESAPMREPEPMLEAAPMREPEPVRETEPTPELEPIREPEAAPGTEPMREPEPELEPMPCPRPEPMLPGFEAKMAQACEAEAPQDMPPEFLSDSDIKIWDKTQRDSTQAWARAPVYRTEMAREAITLDDLILGSQLLPSTHNTDYLAIEDPFEAERGAKRDKEKKTE